MTRESVLHTPPGHDKAAHAPVANDSREGFEAVLQDQVGRDAGIAAKRLEVRQAVTLQGGPTVKRHRRRLLRASSSVHPAPRTPRTCDPHLVSPKFMRVRDGNHAPPALPPNMPIRPQTCGHMRSSRVHEPTNAARSQQYHRRNSPKACTSSHEGSAPAPPRCSIPLSHSDSHQHGRTSAPIYGDGQTQEVLEGRQQPRAAHGKRPGR